MKKTLFILFFLVAMVTVISAQSLTIRAYDNVTTLPISAHIFINNVDTGHVTPYTFSGAEYVSGDYSCQLTGYVSWLPIKLTIGVRPPVNIIYPFFGIPDEEQTPIVLSSFSAIVTAEMFVVLAWTTESETDHAGYNLLRGEDGDLAAAIKINGTYIMQDTQVGTQSNYTFTDDEVYPGTTYYYWLESVSLSGSTEYYGPVIIELSNTPDGQEIPPIPKVTELLNAYPNPFNPSATLQYTVKDAAEVKIQVYNTRGQLIRQFESSHSLPGCYSIVWDGKDIQGNNVCSGVYLYRMTSGTYSATKKMLLSK